MSLNNRKLFLLIILCLNIHLAQSETLFSDKCNSVQGKKITHRDWPAKHSDKGHRILAIGNMHGDEPQSHQLIQEWINRLDKIKTPSNSWRIIPVLNPDGTNLKTRYNANGVDINRNFPTRDWDKQAHIDWKKSKSVMRRFPGKSAGSEPETNCLLEHIESFKPDIVVSIHIPYGLLDFDGPQDRKIDNMPLPWKRLGTFSGSLGRYLWDERNIPVLTVELFPHSLDKHKSSFLKLQDQVSSLLLDNKQ